MKRHENPLEGKRSKPGIGAAGTMAAGALNSVVGATVIGKFRLSSASIAAHQWLRTARIYGTVPALKMATGPEVRPKMGGREKHDCFQRASPASLNHLMM
jgi:hypothetical protein